MSPIPNKSPFIATLLLLSSVSAAADTLSDYLALVTGSFDSSAQAARDNRYDVAIWHTVEIWPGGEDVRWTYSENWLADADKPYRQRINRYTLDDDGSILVDSFPVPEAESFVGGWQTPERFARLDASQLPAASGCPARLARTGPQRFEGGTDGQTCRNNWRGASYLVSRSVASTDGVSNWDRGFAEDGSQVWGPVSGPYRFTRQGSDTACTQPVLMLVHGEIHDRKAFGAYVAALGASGLYPAHRGYYRAISPAIDVFEGEPPASRGVVMARFPCAAAARAFWDSAEYQKIKTLRAGKAEFEVLLLNEFPVPDYVDWQ